MKTGSNPKPITVAYFYKVRWGFHDEWLDLFKRNHWPLLRDGLKSGRYTAVKLYQPRFHGDGRADWDVMVTITYRNWPAMEEHTEADVARRLFPDQALYLEEEQRRFELLEAHWDVALEDLEL